MQFSRPSARLYFIELIAQKSVRGAKKQSAFMRDKSHVTLCRIFIEILIEQDVRIVSPIRKIVDHHNLTRVRTADSLPCGIQCVVIDNKTVDLSHRAQHRCRLLCVLLLRDGQPRKISRKHLP